MGLFLCPGVKLFVFKTNYPYVCQMKLISIDKQKKVQDTLEIFQNHLKTAVAMFYEQVGDDEEYNEQLFDDFNMGWKRLATEANRTQKHTKIDVFAFEKQIEIYKQIALDEAIKLQENGHDQNEANSNGPTRAEQGTNSGTTEESPTLTASVTHYHYKYARKLNNCEMGLGGSFPADYDFKKMQPRYLIGMSVPPIMTAQIANQIFIQWFKQKQL
jgi:site-specific DNA-cytosine methylase